MRNSLNIELLDFANNLNSWHYYKKTKPIWARKLTQSQVAKTLEGEITYQAGDYLCKGPMGDIWGQKAESLFKKYDPVSDSILDKDGWQKYAPKADALGVMATQVDSDFKVEHPTWGTMKGKAGDFLVKNYEDKNRKYPNDIWIVRKKIFKFAYQKV